MSKIATPRLCLGRHQTCSRLPECIAPRRWYNWVTQQIVILMLLCNYSLCCCSQQYRLDRRTIRRWWNELHERSHEFELFLRVRFPDLGRSMRSIQQKIELVKSFFRLPDILVCRKVCIGVHAKTYETINTCQTTWAGDGLLNNTANSRRKPHSMLLWGIFNI